ncbi:MAG: GGDEF domain-containing protein, partial [Fervidobacterium sp.]
HSFIRTYLSHVKASDYETKIVILTRRAYNDEAKLDLSQFFMREYLQYVDSYLDLCRNTEPQSKQDKIIENLSYNTKILTVLGQKFTHNELVILENILGINIEPCLKDLINNKIVSFEANEYYFEKNLWQKIYQVFPDEKRKLHLKLAKKLEEIRDPFNENLSKAAFHYEMSGRSLRAVILYIKFVRRNLDSYVFSIEKMKEALKNAYNILKRYDRLNSIAWNNTVIKFFYQTLEKIPEYTFIDVLSNFEKGNIPRKLKTLLSLYAYYIGEEYSKVIQLYSQTFTDTLSTLDFSNLYTKDFMWLKAYLIYQRAHYSLDDTLKDLDNFKAISDEIPEKNETWSNLKAEYMLLYGMAMNYKKPKEAKRYLDKAKQIISELRIRHLEISLENAYGILNDSSALSISCFKNAIQIASEICYIKRSVVPTINLLRSLLYFGFFDELKKEIKKVEHILDISDNVSDITFFYRILSFAPMYEGNYIAAVSLISKSLELEKKYKLQQSSLRALVLNELMNGSFEKARNIIEDNLENPALKTRAFEYLLNLVLNYDNNEKFKETWLNYKNSQYNLLREEILYIFAEKIAYVDESGFLSEIKRWESFYTAANINLSLLYVLLAKYKYFNYKELQIKSAVLENEICKLANSMGSFSHPLIEKCFKNLGKDRKRQDQKVKENLEDALEELLHVFKRLDSDISIEHFVELFASQIYRIFKPEKFLISINDKLTGLEYEISNTDELPDSELLILHPFEVFVKDYIDSKASYKIYIYSEQIKLSGTSTSVFLSTVTLIEELFSGQLKGLISRERSNIDSLTGLYNRWRFNYLLNQKMEDKSKVFSVFLLDIDDFKKVNDTYGHAFGDRVLKSIADSIKKIVVLESKGKEDNFVARYGGEEFIGVINGSMLEAYEICEDLRKYVENNSAALLGFKITVSIGIAESAEKENMTELIGLADQRLYAVKNSGKNRVEIG